jgi:hypothetical protein
MTEHQQLRLYKWRLKVLREAEANGGLDGQSPYERLRDKAGIIE